MTHAAARRRSLPGNETDNGNLHVHFDPFRSFFFGVAPDFPDQDDGVRVGIFVEKFDGIEKRGADDGVTTSSDAGGLSAAESGSLIDGLVGQCGALAATARISLLMKSAGQYAEF